jgi:pyruvate/2-oxoglutarate dehydrogenase complex dihydrolipoamide acyltransferase (E2) component
MKIYTIENATNNITIHASAKEAEAVIDAQRFRNQAGLAKLAADWPMARLIEIWNSLPGVTPVKKFKDRGTAAERIWNIIEGLESRTGEAPSADAATDATAEPVAAADAPATEKASPASKARTEPAGAKAPRENSNTSQVIAMLKREAGVSVEEIMAAMQWQKHTTRALLSAGGSLTRKHGLIVISEKVGEERRYFIRS